MKRIVFFLIVGLILTACKTTKQATTLSETKTEQQNNITENIQEETKINTELNTQLTVSDSETVVENIVVFEFSQPDSVGKQYIVKTTTINRNKIIQNRLSTIDNSKQTTEAKKNEQKTDNTSIKTNENTKKQTTTVTKTKTPGWVYPVSILIALGLLFLIYLLLKRYKIL